MHLLKADTERGTHSTFNDTDTQKRSWIDVSTPLIIHLGQRVVLGLEQTKLSSDLEQKWGVGLHKCSSPIIIRVLCEANVWHKGKNNANNN